MDSGGLRSKIDKRDILESMAPKRCGLQWFATRRGAKGGRANGEGCCAPQKASMQCADGKAPRRWERPELMRRGASLLELSWSDGSARIRQER